jgi:hypothetical protein
MVLRDSKKDARMETIGEPIERKTKNKMTE